MRWSTKAVIAVLLIFAVNANADLVRTRPTGGGGGVATAVTPGTTTVTGCQNRVLFGDNSSVLNCEAALGYDAATDTLTAGTAAFSTLLTIPAGTTAATGTLLANDTDTWIGSPAQGNISFYTNGNERARIGSTGVTTVISGLAIGAVSGPGLFFGPHATNVARLSSSVADNSYRFIMGGGAAVASAAALPVPTGSLFHVTGTTNITSLTTTSMGSGVCFTMIFDGVLTVTDGSNLVLAGNFVTSAGDTLTGCFDGTNFYETSRSNND
jgi:hypothetical protein